MRTCRLWLLVLVIFALATGCSQATLSGSTMPGAKLSARDILYVEKFEPDNRGLEAVIRDQLIAMGHTASSGPPNAVPENAKLIVTYQDRWMWDFNMFLLQLDIQLKDVQTKRIVATGQSYRTSLVRKSPSEMAREILDKIFTAGN